MNRVVSELRKKNKICRMDTDFIFNLACRVCVSKSDDNLHDIPVVITTKKKTCLTKFLQTEKNKLKCISNVCRKYINNSHIFIITIVEDGTCELSLFENPNSLTFVSTL